MNSNGGTISKSTPERLVETNARPNLPSRGTSWCELAGLNSADGLATWAHRILPAKNTLTAADARLLEDTFASKLTTLADAGEEETQKVRTADADSVWLPAGRKRSRRNTSRRHSLMPNGIDFGLLRDVWSNASSSTGYESCRQRATRCFRFTLDLPPHSSTVFR